MNWAEPPATRLLNGSGLRRAGAPRWGARRPVAPGAGPREGTAYQWPPGPPRLCQSCSALVAVLVSELVSMIGRTNATRGSVQKIAAGKVVRVLPQVRQRRLRRRHGRLNLRGAERVIQGDQQRKQRHRRSLPVSRSFQGTNGTTAERPEIGTD